MLNIFKHVEQIALRPSIHPEEEPVRQYIIEQLTAMKKDYTLDAMGNIHLIANQRSRYLVSAHMDKQAPPYYEDLGDFIKGKLDDAVGCGIILSLSEHYDLNAIITVGEETASIGAMFAIKRDLIPEVEGIIIIDTSPNMNMGDGLIFYTSFNGITPDPSFVEKIHLTAQKLNIRLQPMPGAINDGSVFANKYKNTIAIEPHIDNFHTAEEIASKRDIIDTYRLIETLLKQD